MIEGFDIPKWIAVVLLTAPCSLVFGLLFMPSVPERAALKPIRFLRLSFLFGSESVGQLLASGLAGALIGSALLFGPSYLLLALFHLLPVRGDAYVAWWSSLLLGAGLGKLIRWWRWRQRQDFV